MVKAQVGTRLANRPVRLGGMRAPAGRADQPLFSRTVCTFAIRDSVVNGLAKNAILGSDMNCLTRGRSA